MYFNKKQNSLQHYGLQTLESICVLDRVKTDTSIAEDKSY